MSEKITTKITTLDPLECALSEAQAFREQVGLLQAENSELREELEAVGTAAYLYGRDDLKVENAKLRELCGRFSEYVSHDRCEGCVVKRRCNDGEIDECWQMGEIRKLARKLGVEVDDG